MSRLLKLTAGLLVVPILAFAPTALAAGQVEGGNIYRVKNVTKNTGFTDPANAACGETIQFRVHVHNIGPDPLVNTVVKATLPSGNVDNFTSTVTVKADNTQPATTSDTATVNLSANASVAYINGTSEVQDVNGNKVATLPDGITQGGVKLPSNVGVSVDNSRFVRFQAKVNCPTKPEQPKPEQPQVKGETSKTPEVLPSTGAGEVAGMFAGASAAGAAAHAAVRRFRREQ